MFTSVNELLFTINNDNKLKKFFNKTNRKYSIEYLLKLIIYILINGVSYRNF
jgi:hypothetical protein